MNLATLKNSPPNSLSLPLGTIARPTLLGACLAVAVAFHAIGDPAPVTFAQTSPAAQKTIQTNIGTGKITAIQKNEESGQPVYTVDFTKDGQSRDMEVGDDGGLLSIEVALAETPPAVQKSIQAQLGTSKLEAIEKTFAIDETTYEIDATTKDGRETQFSIGEDGSLVEMEIALTEVPPAVQKAIAAQLGKDTLVAINKETDEGKVTYDVDINRGGKDNSFTVADNGRLLSIEITLEETGAAQKTIREKVGNGKILGVFKSFEKRDKVFPFNVQSVKDGKPFNFSVGPKGKFLGMDD